MDDTENLVHLAISADAANWVNENAARGGQSTSRGDCMKAAEAPSIAMVSLIK
jgi:hypothetical protein